ncbi:hypothetical protein F511_15697 [Dorcoceras hygrometricum]|uniref:Uncharacterized protein n=1 Tax=Dorcoceras hygrometricum TaxID=472368 RepID=A0A2Z7BG78_9LAMI|nr:hypothetical protein F511_15697 [Dorcoceras hygrometricum]
MTVLPLNSGKPRTCVTLNGSGIQLAVGPQPLRLRNHNSALAQRIMVKRIETSPHDPLGITDSACKNQSVVVSVQYGPFNPYIPIRSTTIGKSRVARDPIAMHTSWRSNSDIASVTRFTDGSCNDGFSRSAKTKEFSRGAKMKKRSAGMMRTSWYIKDGSAATIQSRRKQQLIQSRASMNQLLLCIQSQDVVPVASKLQRYESSRSDEPAAKQLTIYEELSKLDNIFEREEFCVQRFEFEQRLIYKGSAIEDSGRLRSRAEVPSKDDDVKLVYVVSHTVAAGVHLWSLGVLTAAGYGIGSVHELAAGSMDQLDELLVQLDVDLVLQLRADFQLSSQTPPKFDPNN